MRRLIALLILVNSGLYLWSAGHQSSDSGLQTGKPDVHPEVMELAIQDGLLKANKNTADELTSTSSVAVCYRIGPFYKEQDAETSADYLSSHLLSFNSIYIPERKVRAYRVYLGPFLHPRDIAIMRQRLVKLNVRDHYLKREQGGELISLGLFTQRDRARSVQKQLEDKHFSPLMRAENRALPPTYWLELRLSGGTLTHDDALADRQWPGGSVRYLETRCKQS